MKITGQVHSTIDPFFNISNVLLRMSKPTVFFFSPSSPALQNDCFYLVLLKSPIARSPGPRGGRGGGDPAPLPLGLSSPSFLPSGCSVPGSLKVALPPLKGARGTEEKLAGPHPPAVRTRRQCGLNPEHRHIPMPCVLRASSLLCFSSPPVTVRSDKCGHFNLPEESGSTM